MKSSDRRKEVRVYIKQLVQISSRNSKWKDRMVSMEMETLSSGGVSVVCPQLLDAELDQLIIRILSLDGAMLEAEVENVWQRIDPQCVSHRYGFAFVSLSAVHGRAIDAMITRRISDHAIVPPRRQRDHRSNALSDAGDKRQSDRRQASLSS